MEMQLPPGWKILSYRSRFPWKVLTTLSWVVAFWLLFLPSDGIPSFMASNTAAIPTQRSKSASPHVKSAMAVLATLEQAQVLPPEGTREADRVIQSVIQLQSVFAKGTDPSTQEFARRALTAKHGEHAQQALERFRSDGWTADILEALADADMKASDEERERLTAGLGQFNLSVADFSRLMQLVRNGRSALAARGQHFEDVYAQHRHTAPGAASHESL